MTNEGRNTHAKPSADEVNSAQFLDVEVRYCIALLRIQHRAVVCPVARLAILRTGSLQFTIPEHRPDQPYQRLRADTSVDLPHRGPRRPEHVDGNDANCDRRHDVYYYG